MLVLLTKNCTEQQSQAIQEAIQRMGFSPLPVPGANRTAICITGNPGAVDPSQLSQLPGVLECIRVTKSYKLVSREVQPEDTVIKVGKVEIGGKNPVLIAGSCSVETEARTMALAKSLQANGAQMFRAGAFKPRTSPYSFQGLGEEALITLQRVRDELGMPVVSEVLDKESVDLMVDHIDILQVGARNMQNFSLLKHLAKVSRPILLKRGLCASLEEWLMAAEYLLAGGNSQVILCERGIRTFSDHSRNTLDLNVVPLVRRLSHLPILVDPSHGVGYRDRVRPLARAGMAAGAQGLLVEAHQDPDTSYTDADQAVDVPTLKGISRDMKVLEQLEDILTPSLAAV